MGCFIHRAPSLSHRDDYAQAHLALSKLYELQINHADINIAGHIGRAFGSHGAFRPFIIAPQQVTAHRGRVIRISYPLLARALPLSPWWQRVTLDIPGKDIPSGTICQEPLLLSLQCRPLRWERLYAARQSSLEKLISHDLSRLHH